MELVKKIVFILVVLLYGCKQPSNAKNVKDNKNKEINTEKTINKKAVIKVPKSIINENSLNCFTKENETKHIEDEDLFVFKKFSLELTNCEMAICDLKYKYKDKTIFYKLTDDFDAGDLKIWLYKLNSDYIFLLELDDFYSSLFYIYIYIDGNLTRLGDTSIDQPNVEDTGIKKESFKICKENDTILLESYLDNKLYSTHKLKIEKKNVVKKAEK